MIHKKIIFLLFIFCFFNVQSQPTNQIAKFVEGDAADQFGKSVCVSGDYAIVGARDYNNFGTGDATGAAYIYYNDAGTWTKTATLIADDADLDDSFGYNVYISGDYAIVGALYDDDYGAESGSAYIFYNDAGTWTQTAKLTPSDLSAADYFGAAVSINEDYAIIGSPLDDDNVSNSGSAYIYYNNAGTWTQAAKINASDAGDGDYFGSSVNIYGDYAIVGAYNHNNTQGAAYIYYNDGGTWTQEAKLTASDGADDDRFSYSAVAINDTYAVVGAYAHSAPESSCGAAYIFEKPGTGWTDMTETQKLLANDNDADDDFGKSVSIYQNYLVIGASGDSENGTSAGAAYIFENELGTWTITTKLTADDGDESDTFGESVSISENYIFIGAQSDEENGTMSGSAYVFGPNLPIITSQPSSLTDQCGDATVQFSVTSDNTTAYQWQIDQGSGFMDLNENSTFVNTQTNVLTVNLNPTLDGAEFRCVLSNIGGQTISDTASLTLENIPPSIYLNSNYLIEIDQNGEATVNPDEIIIQIYDVCGIADTIISPNQVSCNDVGMANIDVTAIDVTGNTSTNTAQIEVVDNIPPDETTLADITDECSVTATTPTTTDNCAGTITGTTTDPLTYTEQGTYTITWNFDDGNGNSIDVEQTVIVDDVTNPTITCVNDQTVDLTQGQTSYIVQGDEFNATADDNCEVENIENDYNNTATLDGEEFTPGTYTITWTATDVGGNTNECIFVLTVNEFVGIADLSESEFSIYPNPTTGVIIIASEAKQSIKNIEITNLTGKTIQQFNNLTIQQYNNLTIDLTNQPTGIYFLKIITNEGLFTEKIIKQ